MICKNVHDIGVQAFDIMDVKLDFASLFRLNDVLKFTKKDQLRSEYKEIFDSPAKMKSTLMDGKMFYKPMSFFKRQTEC